MKKNYNNFGLIIIFLLLIMSQSFQIFAFPQEKLTYQQSQSPDLVFTAENLQDKASYTNFFETNPGEYIRLNITTDISSTSEIILLIEDVNKNGIFHQKASNFDELFSPVLNNSGTWQFWVTNPGTFAGGDFIDVRIEIYYDFDLGVYQSEQSVATTEIVTQDSSDSIMTKTEVISGINTETPNELTETITFPYSLDLGDQGQINSTLRLLTGIVPTEIFGINGRSPIDISVSVGKFISSADAFLDNLSVFSILEGLWPIPFFTPFTNDSITIISIPPIKAVLVFNITYVAEFNITMGNGILNQTTVAFQNPGAQNISLTFTGTPATGDRVLINVTWKAIIKAQVIGLGLILPIILKDSSPQNVTALVATFEIEIDKNKRLFGFEFAIILIFPVLVMLRRKRQNSK